MNPSKQNDPRMWDRWTDAGAIGPNPHKVGLSVSFCIAAIIRGEVPENRLKLLVAGTRCPDMAAWENVIKTYRETYWRENPDEGERIIRTLLRKGRVIQPRVDAEATVQLAMDGRGIVKWVNSLEEASAHILTHPSYI